MSNGVRLLSGAGWSKYKFNVQAVAIVEIVFLDSPGFACFSSVLISGLVVLVILVTPGLVTLSRCYYECYQKIPDVAKPYGRLRAIKNP